MMLKILQLLATALAMSGVVFILVIYNTGFLEFGPPKPSPKYLRTLNSQYRLSKVYPDLGEPVNPQGYPNPNQPINRFGYSDENLLLNPKGYPNIDQQNQLPIRNQGHPNIKMSPIVELDGDSIQPINQHRDSGLNKAPDSNNQPLNYNVYSNQNKLLNPKGYPGMNQQSELKRNPSLNDPLNVKGSSNLRQQSDLKVQSDIKQSDTKRYPNLNQPSNPKQYSDLKQPPGQDIGTIKKLPVSSSHNSGKLLPNPKSRATSNEESLNPRLYSNAKEHMKVQPPNTCVSGHIYNLPPVCGAGGCLRNLPPGDTWKPVPGMNEYVTKLVTIVPGWLSSIHIDVVWYLTQAQRRFGIWGSVGEIGVYSGKFTVVLANWLDLKAGERLFACDIFGKKEHMSANTEYAPRDIFERYMNKIGFSINSVHENTTIRTWDDSSIYLSKSVFLTMNLPSFRLFSIDGNHYKPYILLDLILVSCILRDGGIIAVDDAGNIQYPDVRSSIQEYFTHFGTHIVKPLILIHNKLYLVTSNSYNKYVDFIEKHDIPNELNLVVRTNDTYFGPPFTYYFRK